MPAPRKHAPVQTEQHNPILDMLNVKPAAGNATPAPRKSKRDGSPTWFQQHPAFRYDLTDPQVYFAISGIATTLKINNISTLAATMMDYALAMYDQGKVPMQSSVNPNQGSARMTLTWERASGWAQEVKPDYERQQRRRKLIAAPRHRSKSGWFRWTRETHERIKALAAQYDVAQGAIVTRLLEYAVDEYRAGSVKIGIQMVASRDVSGWSAE